MMGKIPSAINAKFADLGPYLSGDKVKDYPNLAAVPTDAWQRSIFGGKLRGLPMPAPYVTGIVPFYRKDVFDKKGYELPKSRRRVPVPGQGDHQRQGEGVGLRRHEVDRLQHLRRPVRQRQGARWNLVDGKLINRVETDAYLEALEWTRKLYAAGVVHPDAGREGQGNAGNGSPRARS
jgi:putative aldouronate transport system substrate-binding protein